MRLEISTCPTVTSRAMTARTIPLYRLVDSIRSPRVVDHKGDVGLWAPAIFAGGRRKKSAVESISAIVWDVDDTDRTIDDILAPLVAARVEVYAHTSYSYDPAGAAPGWRGRVIVPLAEPVPGDAVEPGVWDGVWRAATEAWGIPADPACRDASRIYYGPCHRPGAPYDYRLHHGAIGVVPAAVMDEARARQVTRRRRAEARIRARAVSWTDPAVLEGPALHRHVRRRLEVDPAARRALGEAMGGQVVTRGDGEVVSRAGPCPSCGRRSLWWPVTPTGTPHAMCAHLDSCGTTTPLHRLSVQTG